MIFEDSLEYDGFFPANGAELISMKKWQDIKLSEIWIPSELLPNRDLPFKLNSNKPVLYHTLEKPKLPVDSLSVYSELDTATSYCNSEKLLDSLEDFSYRKRGEEYEATTSIDEDYPGSFNGELNSNDQEIFESRENSFANLLEHLCLSDNDAEDTAIESIPVSEQSSKDHIMHLENQFNKELSNSDYRNADFIEKSDVSYNDNNERHFSKESDLNHDRFSKMPVECEIVDADCKLSEFINSNIHNINENGNPNSGNISRADSFNDACLLKSKFLYPKPGNDIVNEVARKEAGEVSVGCKQTEAAKLAFATENENTLIQAEPVSFPTLYTLSKKEETVSDTAGINKRKVKKDKRTKKKTSKNIDLCNFFLNEKERKDKQSDVPDYLKYLLEKERGNTSPVESNCNLSSSDTVFPSLPETSGAENAEWFRRIEEDEIEEVKRSLKLVTDILKESSSPPVTDETVSVDIADKGIEIKIVIENIPLGVDNETVESILLNYGTITRLTLRRHGIFLKADVQMCLDPHIEDPEWIIECLNGSQPFGVSSTCEELKCYLRK